MLTVLLLTLSTLPAFAQSPDSSAAEIFQAEQNHLIPHTLIGEDLTRGLTHAELSSLAVRLYMALNPEKHVVPVPAPYEYVRGHQLESEMEFAYGLGFLLDMDGMYYPDNLVTRQRASQVLCRVVKSSLYGDWTLETDNKYFLDYSMRFRFADDREIDSSLADSVYFLAVNGFLPGMNDDMFCPLDVISRASAIIASNRIFLAYRNTISGVTDKPVGEIDLPVSITDRPVPVGGQTAVPADQSGKFALMGKKFSGYYKRFGLVKSDGSLWTWGEKYLGNGESGGSSIPVRIMNDVDAVYMGMDASLALKTDGTLWAWGSNYGYIVGNGQNSGDQLSPVKILDNVVTASMGTYTAAAVTGDGGLYVWGYNADGNLGTNIPSFGGVKEYLTPTRIMEDVAAVSCNNANYGAFTMVLKKDGTLWTFGADQTGQLGDGITDLSNRYWNNSDGGKFGRPPYEWEPHMIMDNVAAIHAGDRMGAAIQTDGTLWTWGWNRYDRLGNGGKYNANAVDDNHVPCQTVPMQIAENAAALREGYGGHTVILKNDGTVWACGREFSNVPAQLNISGVAAIAASEFDIYALKEDGTLWRSRGGSHDFVQLTDISR